jgi:hypothetical protein
VSARTKPDGVGKHRVPSRVRHNVQPRARFPAGYDASGWLSAENFSRGLAYFRSRGIHCSTHREIVAAPRSPYTVAAREFCEAFLAFFAARFSLSDMAGCFLVSLLLSRLFIVRSSRSGLRRGRRLSRRHADQRIGP